MTDPRTRGDLLIHKLWKFLFHHVILCPKMFLLYIFIHEAPCIVGKNHFFSVSPHVVSTSGYCTPSTVTFT